MHVLGGVCPVFSLYALIILVIAYPLYFVVIASFSQPEAVLGGKLRFLPIGFNVDSYKMVLTERKVWVGYRNTIFYTVFGTCINLTLTTLAAYPLSRRDMPFRGPLTFVASFTMLFGGGMIPPTIIWTVRKRFFTGNMSRTRRWI